MKINFLPNPKPEPKPKKAKQPLKRKAIKKKFTKIKPMSKKREAENKVYLMLREKFLRDNPVCPITEEPTTEVHHTYSGKDRGHHFLHTKTWIAVSRSGHNWIHENPKEARELGYLM